MTARDRFKDRIERLRSRRTERHMKGAVSKVSGASPPWRGAPKGVYQCRGRAYVRVYAYLAFGVDVCLGRDERLDSRCVSIFCSGMQGRIPVLQRRMRVKGGARRRRARWSERSGRADGQLQRSGRADGKGRGTGSRSVERGAGRGAGAATKETRLRLGRDEHRCFSAPL